MTLPVLLGDLIRDGKLLWLYCRDCFRERDVDPSTIALPPDMPVPEIGKRMKCSACGSRRIDSRRELYPHGIEAQRRPRPSQLGSEHIFSTSVGDNLANSLIACQWTQCSRTTSSSRQFP